MKENIFYFFRAVGARTRMSHFWPSACTQQQRRHAVLQACVPWIALVVLTVVATVISNTTTLEGNNESSTASTWQRWLQGTNSPFSSTPAFGEPGNPFSSSSSATTTSSNNNFIVPPVHHDPVFSNTHPSLLPLTTRDILGFIFATCGLLLAAGGGIGGGGLLVPIYCLIFQFSPKHAIPLSNVTVLGGAVANTVLNWSKRHPVHNRPLMDWDLILIMEPLTIAGALGGAILNKLIPELILTILLVILLSVTAWKTLDKANKLYQAESRVLDGAGAGESELTVLASAMDEDDDEEDVGSGGYRDNPSPMEQQQENIQVVSNNKEEELTTKDSEQETTDSFEDAETQGDDSREQIHELQKQWHAIVEAEKTVPMENVRILVVLFIVVLAMNLLKGGGSVPSPIPGLTCGSTLFWLAQGALLLWIVTVSAYARRVLLRKHRTKLAAAAVTPGANYPPIVSKNNHSDGNDIVWDEQTTIQYPVLCAMAGFFAGMFGIGTYYTKGWVTLVSFLPTTSHSYYS